MRYTFVGASSKALISLLCLVCVLPSSDARIMSDDTETPRTITIGFSSGSASFVLDKGIVDRIVFWVSENQYSSTFIGCQSLEHIRFETAKFFNGVSDRVKVGTFTLTFQMGNEDSRAFGELPLVQISVVDGKTAVRLITRQTSEHGGFTSPLCSNERPT